MRRPCHGRADVFDHRLALTRSIAYLIPALSLPPNGVSGRRPGVDGWHSRCGLLFLIRSTVSRSTIRRSRRFAAVPDRRTGQHRSCIAAAARNGGAAAARKGNSTPLRILPAFGGLFLRIDLIPPFRIPFPALGQQRLSSWPSLTVTLTTQIRLGAKIGAGDRRSMTAKIELPARTSLTSRRKMSGCSRGLFPNNGSRAGRCQYPERLTRNRRFQDASGRGHS